MGGCVMQLGLNLFSTWCRIILLITSPWRSNLPNLRRRVDPLLPTKRPNTYLKANCPWWCMSYLLLLWVCTSFPKMTRVWCRSVHLLFKCRVVGLVERCTRFSKIKKAARANFTERSKMGRFDFAEYLSGNRFSTKLLPKSWKYLWSFNTRPKPFQFQTSSPKTKRQRMVVAVRLSLSWTKNGKPFFTNSWSNKNGNICVPVAQTKMINKWNSRPQTCSGARVPEKACKTHEIQINKW